MTDQLELSGVLSRPDSGALRIGLVAEVLTGCDKLGEAEEAPERVSTRRVSARAQHAGRSVYDRYQPLVRRVALRVAKALPASVGLDDAIAAGWLGLLDAQRRRTEQMSEENFEAYASCRIRGAILDHLRAQDPLKRGLRQSARRLSKVMDALTGHLGRVPEEGEVAAALQISLHEYQQLLMDLKAGVITSSDQQALYEVESPNSMPEMIVDRRKVVTAICKAVEDLPHRLGLVIALYYQDELSFREIGTALGVTESRVCQLHGAAVCQLRVALHEGVNAADTRHIRN